MHCTAEASTVSVCRRAAVRLRLFPRGECVRGLRALETPAGSAVPLRGGHEGEDAPVSGPHRRPLPSAGRNPAGLLCGYCVAEQLPHHHASGALHDSCSNSDETSSHLTVNIESERFTLLMHFCD